MKRQRLFWKLFLGNFIISVVSILMLLAAVRYAVEVSYYKENVRRLEEKVALQEETILKNFSNTKNLQEEVLQVSQKAHNRVTVIGIDGVVLGDSSHDPSKMNNHRDRPEFKKALKESKGVSWRDSHTLGQKQLYYAVPLKKNSKTIGVLRNSVTIEGLAQVLSQITKRSVLIGVFVIILIALFLFWFAGRISKPMELLREQVESIADGDFSSRVEPSPSFSLEMNALAESFNRMARKIYKQVGKILKQKNEQDAIFSSMVEGILTLDRSKNIFHYNKAFFDLLGGEHRDDLKGAALSTVCSNREIDEIATEILEKEITIEREISISVVSDITLYVIGSVLYSPWEEKLGVVLVVNDLTQLKKLEVHRKQFVANVSHELRTPLTSIQGYVETLIEGVDEDKTRERFLDVIKRHTIRLNGIIEDLLTLSRIENDDICQTIELHEHNITAIADEAMKLSQKKADDKQITLEFLPSDDVRAQVNLNLLEQAIYNLVENAIKYSPESDGAISVQVLFVENDMFEIRIKDNGIGIDPKHHTRLFERFYCVDKARSRQMGGSGLGLAIVKHISLVHRGEVDLISQKGDGAMFILRLPVRVT